MLEGDAKNLRRLDIDEGEPNTAQMDVQHLDGDQLERRRLGRRRLGRRRLERRRLGGATGRWGAVLGAGVGGDAQPLGCAHHGALGRAHVELAYWADRMQL